MFEHKSYIIHTSPGRFELQQYPNRGIKMAKSENDVTLSRNYVMHSKWNQDNFVTVKYLFGSITDSQHVPATRMEPW